MISIDVLIPVYRPGKEFHELLSRLEKQKTTVRRIQIMNTEVRYWDPEWEKEFPSLRVRHLTREEFDHGKTRREGALLSDADFLLCMTQDALPADSLLTEALLAPMLQNEKVAASYARQLPKKDSGLLEAVSRSFNYPMDPVIKWKEDLPTYGIKTYFCSNVCAMYRKTVYNRLGGFLPRAVFNEDMIYAHRMIQAGYGIAYAPQARVYHSHSYSALQQFHRNFDLGVSQAEHPEVFAKIPSEGEGTKLVKYTALQLLKKGHPGLLPRLILQSGAKYLGYQAGKHYRSLPPFLIRSFTMNPVYWDRKQDGEM